MISGGARSAALKAVPPESGTGEIESISCGRCRRSYSRLAWGSLPKVCTLTADDVQKHVIDWRDERVIEVRACAACGRSMARMVRIAR
jgi:hypothetical protein